MKVEHLVFNAPPPSGDEFTGPAYQAKLNELGKDGWRFVGVIHSSSTVMIRELESGNRKAKQKNL